MTPTSSMTPATPPSGSARSGFARCARRAGAGAASLLRGLCGSAAGVGWGARRRGSTIVLVVASLALFAVITVAYVGLGIGDRRTSSVTLASDQVDDVASRVRDYLVDVIGRDAVAVLVEPGPRNTLLITREAWDYPWTDPQRVSDGRVTSRAGAPAIRFDPAGTMPREMVELARLGAARWGEPFAGSDPWLASTEPTWFPDPTLMGGAPPWGTTEPYYNYVFNGWWQISNFAPDGRFVNLHALRNNFDAAPGTRPGEMSEQLGLLDDLGRSQGARHNTIHGERADKNVPAHWTMFQEGAARPVGPGLDSSGRPLRPGDSGYAPNSWVDADGDGILDSRWFELVDAYDSQNIIPILPRDTRWRWFVAARAIDLSSLVNINTARDVSDGAGAPSDNHPIGFTPADIDVLRLFTLEDEFALNPNSAGYGDVHQPVRGGFADYSDYSDDFQAAEQLGLLAYQAIKEGAQSGVVPPEGEALTPTVISADDREEHYMLAGAANPGGARWDRAGASGRFINGAAFGIQDLVELLTHHGLNDSTTISRLERMVGGRDTATGQQGYSPMRENRPTDVEGIADVTDASGAGSPATPNPDGQLDRERRALLAMDPRRRLTTISGATQRRSSAVPYAGPPDVPLAIASIHADSAPGKAHPRALLDLAAGPTGAGIGSAGVLPDPAPLFAVYARALLPQTEQDTWTRPEQRTMFYGHDPLFALRAAAHLTANRIDSWDNETALAGQPKPNEEPTAFTVLLNEEARSAVGSNPQEFPWWQPGAGVGVAPAAIDFAREDLALGELSTDAAVPEAVNVYGIEPQPFLVQAATFMMYTDTPLGKGTGDQEWTDPPGGPGGGMGAALRQPATIDGEIPSPLTPDSNSDFLFQAVVFQLTNPFDEQVSLADYSVEFGGRRYNLNDSSGASILLDGGETKLVYYLSQDESDIESRMQIAAYDPGGSFTFSMAQWRDYQFTKVGLGGAGGPGEPPVEVVELERTQPVLGGAADSLDLLTGDAGDVSVEANRAVLLWRMLDTPSGNQHQVLVDRLRDPATPDSRPTLDRRLDDRNNEIAGEDALVGPPPDPADEGFSITLWGTIRRPEDPRAGTTPDPLPRGGLPAWCIESRFGNGLGGELNLADTDDANPDALHHRDFESSAGEQRLTSLMLDQTGGSGGTPSRLIDTLHLEPKAKTTGLAISPAQQRDSVDYWSTSGVPGIDPELHVGSQRGRPLRLGDMLMAMAVGPVEDPADPRYLHSVEIGEPREEEKWTTLSESLALALGYDEVEGLVTTVPSPSDPVTGPPAFLWSKTDRGFLRLDDYTPFYDGDSDGLYTLGAGSSDILRGDGTPMALRILDAFRPAYGADDSEQFGSLTNPAVGIININTAPPSVLRTLGMLSPTATDLLGGQAGRDWLVGSPHGPESDIVATILAYRDKTLVCPRDLSGGTPQAIAFMSSASSNGPGDPQDLDGRSEFIDNDRFASGEPLPVREQPGFRTLGEVMLARQRDASGSAGPHDIDWLAFTAAMTTEGVESFQYGDAASRFPDSLDRDYDEKLAIFNSIAGNISVRSDLYAVWFVLHGYQREDVEGLTDADPLIPTVAKRFLIIVDRSNVTTEGERPRIVHFQELPL